METGVTKAEELKAEGNKLYQEKCYSQASKKYTEAIENDSTQASYYNNRAACYLMLENPTSAMEDTQQATCLDPELMKGWSRMAKCSLLLGDKVTATTAGNRLNELGESEGGEVLDKVEMLEKYEHSAQAAMTVGKYRDAAYWYRQAVQLSPHCNQMRVGLAECAVYQDMFGEAMEEVNRVLKIDAKDTEAIFVRGICFYYQDMADNAIEHFKTVLKLSPDHEKAKEMFKRVKKLTNLKDCGNEAFKAGDFLTALIHYTEALSVDYLHKNLNSKLYFNRATVHSKLGDLEKCVDDCTAALENDHNYLKPLLRRAKTYMDMKDFENAVKDYEKAHANNPQNIEIKELLRESKHEIKKVTRKDYYSILNIDTSASDEEIKRAYRTQAMKHHPDKHSNDVEKDKELHEKMFKEVGEAYAILSDTKQKEIFDKEEDIDDAEWDVDEDGNIDSEAIWQQFFGGEQNTYYAYL